MKKTAFLQALVLLILLSLSWMILFMRMNNDSVEGESSGVTAPGQDESTVSQGFPDTQEQQVEQQEPAIGDGATIPSAWQEWISYLQQQSNPSDLWEALQSMRESLFSLPADQQRLRLLELIGSGYNMTTGIRFRVGREGTLSGAPDLQTLLLDWLGQVDPVMAAATGKQALLRSGYSLGPDRFVVHLRNYVNGTQDNPAQKNRFVRDQFDLLLANAGWIENPTASIAESMAIAVYIGDGNLVRDLSELMQSGANPGIAHASSIAIERLVDIDPLPSAKSLIESVGASDMNPTARAGFMARLNPADPRELELLTGYISPSVTSRQEAISFLQYFPNLNRTFSNNLVSHQNTNTGAIDHMDRLDSALDAVRYWQAIGIRSDLSRELLATERRLDSQINGIPAP